MLPSLVDIKAVFHWQTFATNRQKSVISIGPFKNPPMELTDFERFVAKICQWKTALVTSFIVILLIISIVKLSF